MKKVFNFIAVAVVALSFGLSGCSNEDPASPLDVDMNRTATIQGTILINTDEFADADKQTWSSPKEISVIATVDYDQLNPLAASGSYTVPTSAITYSKGNFSFKIPVGVGATDIKVKVQQFTGTVDIKDPADATKRKTVNVIWDEVDYGTVSVSPAQTKILDEKKLERSLGDCTDVVIDGDKVN